MYGKGRTTMMRSEAVSFRYSTIERVLLTILRWDSVTPLGRPVLPDV